MNDRQLSPRLNSMPRCFQVDPPRFMDLEQMMRLLLSLIVIIGATEAFGADSRVSPQNGSSASPYSRSAMPTSRSKTSLAAQATALGCIVREEGAHTVGNIRVGINSWGALGFGLLD